MTFLDLKTEITRRLFEVSARVFWTDGDIADAVQLGYAEISDETEWYEQWADLALLNDRPYYDLFTILGPSFLAVKPGFDRQTNRWILPSIVRQLDAHDRRWERVTGEPQRSFTRGLRWLGFYPRIQTEAGLIKQYYTALPPAFVNDTDTPGFPVTYHYGIVAFALTDLWSQDGETQLALAAWQQYLEFEQGLTAWVQGRASGPLMRGFAGSGAPVAR